MVADMFWTGLSYLGAAVLAYHALALLNVLYKTLLASGPKLTKKYGEWAVVTGATDGVGKAMCFELARKGCRRALRPLCAALGVAPDATAAVCPAQRDADLSLGGEAQGGQGGDRGAVPERQGPHSPLSPPLSANPTLTSCRLASLTA